MTLKKYLMVTALATAVCWTIFLFVSSVINPELTSWLGFLLFYLSLFMAVSGTASLIGFLIRFVALKHELAFYAVKIAYRQSFLFALFIIAILILLSQDLFTWLNLFMLVAVFVIAETFMIHVQKIR
ncbi:MAG: hypothetical protein WCK59_04865 [Candidatus Falkowbacteria bacterium]